MLFPIRCKTCGNPLGQYQRSYIEAIQKAYDSNVSENENNINTDSLDIKSAEAKILDKFNIKLYCCRTSILCYKDLTNVIN